MPLVATDSLSDVTRVPSHENTASCSAPSLACMARAPGELISSSPLISTVSVPYCLKLTACRIDTVWRMTATPFLSSAMPRP